MIRAFSGAAVILLASVAFAPSPAMADFAISKSKQKAEKPASTSRTKANRRIKAGNRDEVAPAPAPDPILGIDPELMRETIVEAKYKATLTRDPQAQSALIQATDGKSGWSVNFSGCSDDKRCRTMEFYTLWKVSNEVNVCKVWGTDVTQDPVRTAGKPFCYTVPTLAKQMHIKLSSDQPSYQGMEKLAPPQAKERMQSMISIWAAHLPMLPQAWTIASRKCPRASDKCSDTVSAKY